MKLAVLILIAALSQVPAVAFAAMDDVILERQELMSNTRDALKVMLGMSKGEAPFDAVAVSEALNVMKNTATSAGSMFPLGTETGHDTEAKSTIWSNRQGFDEKMAAFGKAVDDAIMASPQSVHELKTELNHILKTCKGCHDNYRVEKDE